MKARHFSIQTRSKVELVNIDRQIHEAVHQCGIDEGICIVFVPHTTAGVTINENADPDVVRDITMELNRMVPFEDGYRHIEGNAAAHIKSTLVSPSISMIIEGGRLQFGTWQSVFFCEFDGPRTRRFSVKIIEG